MAIILIVIGVATTLLGLLWFLQGTGLVYLPPILCVANCETLTEPSLVWTLTGAIALILGVFLVMSGVNRKSS